MTLTVNVNVKFDPELLEALQTFNQLAAGINEPLKLPQGKPVKTEAEKETAKTKTDEKKESKKKAKPEISIEAVRGKLTAIAQAGKQAEVKKLLEKFGAQKLSAVPAEKYADLLAEAEAI